MRAIVEVLRVMYVTGRLDDDRLDALQMQSDEVLARLTAQARGSMADFVTVDGLGGVNINLKAAQANNSLHLVRKIRKTTRRSKAGNDGRIAASAGDDGVPPGIL